MESAQYNSPCPQANLGPLSCAWQTRLIRSRLTVCFFLFFTAFVAGASIAGDATANPSQNPTILSASETDYPPFCSVDEEGQAIGFSIELLRAALSVMSYDVTFRIGPWEKVRRWLANGQVQVLPLVGRTPEREAIFDFTVPYMSLHGAIVVRADNTDIKSLDDLEGRQVAVMKADNAEEFLRREDRGIQIQTTDTFETALSELSQGEYDAVVVQRLVALRLIQKAGLANLKIVKRPIQGFRQDFCFAVRDGDRETLSLLNEGLSLVIADGTYRHLQAKWFGALEPPSQGLIVVGGDANYPPFEYLDEKGRPAGYNVELTEAIAREMGLNIEIRLGLWAEIQQELMQGEIDVIQGMSYSIEHDQTFDFTQPHSVNHCICVVRKGTGPAPTTLSELADKDIVVERGDITNDFALQHGLERQISTVDSQQAALDELALGKHDCALVSLLTAVYWLEKNGADKLVMARQPILSPEYCYAVLNHRRVLLAQFSDGLRILEETGEYRNIQKKWMGVYAAEPYDLSKLLKYAAIVVIPLIVVLLASIVWSWSLRRRVSQQTQALQQSEAQFRALVENAPDAIFVRTEDRFAYLNRRACKMFGALSADQLLGQPVMDRFPPPVRDRIWERMRRLKISQEPLPVVENTYLRLDGSEFPVEVSAVPIIYKNQEGALLFARDITKRKQQEAERELMMAAIEQAGEMILITDPDGNIQYVNPAFEQTTGFSRQEAVGQNPRILKSGNQEEAFYKNLWETIASGHTWSGQIINKRKDGTLFTEVATISPVKDRSGKIVYYVAVKRNITEQLHLEAQFQQAQKMESVGRLAGGVAHDFNNMLGVIIGRAELALDKMGPNDLLRTDLSEILEAANRSAVITRQLLAFARRQTINPVTLDLNEVVEGMLKMLRRLIGEDINLSWKPKTGLWPIRMDPVQVDQILANLCVNARDAIFGVGRVTIETDMATFDAGD
jgi:PAS domain S-box-containing protein